MILMIVVAILVFGAVIFFHELGHFAAAKKSGIKVNEFALGMGPALLRFGKGETKYSLRLFPIGGYVSMEGEDDTSEDDRSFTNAPIPSRLLVIVAGAFMNFLLGFIALVFLISLGYPAIGSLTIAKVENPASGLMEGDVIRKINGRRAFIYDDLQYEFARTQNGTFDLTVRRDGVDLVLSNVTFETKIAYDPTTGEAIINESTGEPYEYLD